MRSIYRIAKLELSTLFYSPVAWLVLVVFAFQAGLQFVNSMDYYESLQQVGHPLSSLTKSIFISGAKGGLFYEMQSKLFLYIPLLTMGLMSREISSGSIKLLLSSPVSMAQIILGKFGAMMAYGFILILILLVFVFTGLGTIQSIDFPLLFSGLLAIYLILCAYSAIGLFMSSLTSYPVVAAMSTLVVLAILNYVGLLGQKVDVLRDVTYYLSIAGRTNSTINGLISTRDVLYFLIVIAMFLGISILRLQFARESKTTLVKATRYAFVVVAGLCMIYLSSRRTLIGYYDDTVTKNLTLTPNSQKIVKALAAPLTLTTYVNLFDERAAWTFPENMNNDLGAFEQYTRFLPRMDMKYVYYYDTCAYAEQLYFKLNPGLSLLEVAKKTAASFKVDINKFLPPDQIRKLIDLKPEENRLVRQLETGNKKIFLRMFDDMHSYPEESEITAALKHLEVTPPKVAFLTGHNERNVTGTGDRDYKTPCLLGSYRYSLINKGFDVETISITAQDIPADVSILVIADPRSPLNEQERAKIAAYIARGGNLLITGEPGKQDVLNPVIAPLGVQYTPGTLVQLSHDDLPDYALSVFSKDAGTFYKTFEGLYGLKYAVISMPGAMGIDLVGKSPYEITPLLVTKDSSNSWNTLRKIEADSTVKFSPDAGDSRRSFATSVGLKRMVGNKEQRIVITGDADFMSNAELTHRPSSNFERVNYFFYQEVMRLLSNDEFPVDVTRPMTNDTKLNLESSGVDTMRTIFLAVVPAMLVIFSAILLIRRRRN